ncbi:RNA polymerase sigma factor [soil metagenome]
MEPLNDSNPDDIRKLVFFAAGGDRAAWSQLVDRYHPRLRRMVALRMDQRLRARVDPSDVLQEAYLDASNQIADYLANPILPFYLWLRMVAGGRLGKTHRFHLGTKMRDADLEVPLNGPACPGVSSHSLADMILARDNPPEADLERDDRRRVVRDALDHLTADDREVLSLRHFERLAIEEIAQVLNVSKAAAGKRYLRAAARLKKLLSTLPNGQDLLSTPPE